MIKKSTAIIFSIITGLTGIFIGMNLQKKINIDLILSVIIIFNSFLIISTVKSKNNNKK